MNSFFDGEGKQMAQKFVEGQQGEGEGSAEGEDEVELPDFVGISKKLKFYGAKCERVRE